LQLPSGKACGTGYSLNMWPLPEAGAKHEPQLGGCPGPSGLTWCEAQLPNLAEVDGDN